jgi:hypothetical protein
MRHMNLIVVGGALVLVGALLASNVGGLAEKGARLNARAGFLAVNSQANTWRFTGATLVVVGALLALWAAVRGT